MKRQLTKQEQDRKRGNEIAFWVCAAIVLLSCVAAVYAPTEELGQNAFWTGGAFMLVSVYLWRLEPEESER